MCMHDMSVCACAREHTCQGTRMEVREKSYEVSSLFPPLCVSRGGTEVAQLERQAP